MGGRHLQIETCLDTQPGVVYRAPVRDCCTCKTSFCSQYTVQEPVVFTAVHAVQLVVGRHHRPGICLAYRPFKGSQVDLPQCPLVNKGIIEHTPALLIVRGKMLEAGAYAY